MVKSELYRYSLPSNKTFINKTSFRDNMANPSHIIVPSGLLPVHSFDLYGPLVDSEVLAEHDIRSFEQIFRIEGISEEQAVQIISDYRALARGELWATGEKKLPIVHALVGPLKKYPELQPDYKAALQMDGLYVLSEILTYGEGASVFTSLHPEWLIKVLPEDIGARINIYADRKTKPEAFQKVYDAEMSKGRRVVTHTADELPELEAAVQSGLFSGNQGRLIFVNRNDSINESLARSKGIDFYVRDLRKVGYTQLTQK